MHCSCGKTTNKTHYNLLLSQVKLTEHELVTAARNILSGAKDPVSAVIKFLHERPEGYSLTGYVMDHVLKETFGEEEQIPGLIKVLASHVREIIRHSNVINIVNEHVAIEKWGNYLIKQTERIKFEVSKERELLVLNNIAGIFAIEHGIAVPVEKITIQPPNLVVTINLGLLHPKRVVQI